MNRVLAYQRWMPGVEIEVQGPAMNGLPASQAITIPANSVVVFARDQEIS